VQKNSVELVETTGRSLEELAAAGRLASVFCRLARGRFTGVVYVEHDDAGGVFTFRDGMPIYVEDLGSEGMLGEQLLAQGLITAEQHAEIAAAAIGSATENEDLAFCEQAVQLGVLHQAQVDAELERRLRARLIQAVGFTESRIEIDPDPDVVAAVPEYPLDLGPLIHTGVRTFFDEEAVQRVLGTAEELYVRLSVPCSDAVQFFDLGSDEEELVSRLDPQISVERTIAQCAADPLEAWQLVSMLAIAELVELSRVPFAPASDRSGLRSTHAIAGRQPSSTRMPVPREDADAQGSRARMPVARQDVVHTGSVARMPAVRGDEINPAPRSPAVGARPASAPMMPAAREQPARSPSPRSASAPFEAPRVSTEVQRSAQARPAQRADSAQFAPPSRDAQPARVQGSGHASNVSSGPVAMRVPAPSNPDPILPTDRSKPRRKLSAALQRLDRELKDLRGPAAAAPGAGAPVHAPAQEPAAPAGAAKAHVEQLLRMRAQQIAQKKSEGETTNVSDVYRQGQEALRDNQFARAHELLRRACELAPTDQVWQLQMQWAALRAGVLDEEGIAKLRAILRELVSDNDQKKFAYYALGHVALVEKKDDAAEKFFRKAVELDKNNKDAERHLRIIELRRKSASEDRGNKIFGIEIGKKKS
jgi:hypothetical protein